MFNIEEELKKLPGKPGVYIMHDKDDNIIYKRNNHVYAKKVIKTESQEEIKIYVE